MKFFKPILMVALTTVIAISSCTSDFTEENTDNTQNVITKDDITLDLGDSSAKSLGVLSLAQDINQRIQNEGYELVEIEIYSIATSLSDAQAVTVIPIAGGSSTTYRNGNRFVPNDPRRNNRTNLTYVTVSELATSSNGIASEGVFDAMYDVWENETNCNNVSIDRQPLNIATQGLPSSILGLGGGSATGPVADSNIIGFIPNSVFQSVGQGPGTLGVTFTFAFVDANGNRTDINNDGKFDTSHTEIWFNDSVNWSFNGAPGTTSISAVALHEFGHSVGLGHSGTLLAFVDNGQFTLQYTPTNVMNALYINGQPKTDLAGDDNSIYCENFSAWPWY